MKTLGLCLLCCLPTFATVVGWYNGSPQISGAPAIRSQYVVNFPETCGTQPHCLYGVYDDFVVPASGWIVTGVLSHNTMNFSNVAQAYWEIRSGVSAGKPGTLVASGTSPAAQIYLGPRTDPTYSDYEIQVTGLHVALSAGTYWLLVAPVGAGYSYVYTTTGANSVGNPAGNDGQAYYYSGPTQNFIDTTTISSQTANSRDFSMSVLIANTVPTSTAPQINDGGIVIHAGTTAAASPGSLVDIYGANLAAAAISAPAGPGLPLTLGGVQVTVSGAPAPLLYVGPGQIIFQLPYETSLGTASVSVVSNSIAGAVTPLTVQQAAPSILTYGTNRAVVANPDSSVNAPGAGAKPGDAMVAYLIGSGPLDNAVLTGAAAPLSPLSQEKLATTVTVGGIPAKVQFAGMAPTYIGLVQVNFVMPTLPAGDYPIQVTIGGATSNQPLLTVK